jgi:hypothetical protein
LGIAKEGRGNKIEGIRKKGWLSKRERIKKRKRKGVGN